MEFILNHKIKPDLVILQWSAIGRAYSVNEKQFTKRIVEDVANGGIEFAPHMGEYISENGKEGWVTNVIDKISDSFYQNSLSSMIGLQSFLESQDIPYFTFWGWTQFDNELKQKFRPYLDSLYNRNWWKPNKSMSEYITDRYGENGLMGNGDFHPNSGGQRYFYRLTAHTDGMMGYGQYVTVSMGNHFNQVNENLATSELSALLFTRIWP